jgi:hypothetical protein
VGLRCSQTETDHPPRRASLPLPGRTQLSEHRVSSRIPLSTLATSSSTVNLGDDP